MQIKTKIKKEHEKVDQDLEFLMQCLREVLDELGEKDLLAHIPWLNQNGETPSLSTFAKDPTRLVQLQSISFQLLNMVEENSTIQLRREEQTNNRLESENGLWPWALAKMKDFKFSETDIQRQITDLNVEPVLTAHPTEAKRSTVLQHYRELYLQLVKRENSMWTPIEQSWLKNDIKVSLETLWRTGEIYLQRPDVQAELRNVIHYLRNTFPEILTWLDQRFETAWQEAGFQVPPNFMEGQYPKFSLGSWVGGDRDGNPLVSATITREALESLRLNALIVLRQRLTDLSKKLSLSDQAQSPPAVLRNKLAAYQERFPALFQEAAGKNAGESWRILVNIMISRLPVQVVRDHATKLDERNDAYLSPDEVQEDLKALYASLKEIGADRLAHAEFKLVVRTLETFGFHSARLDVRQNSQFHDRAFGQLLHGAGIKDGLSYPDWPAERKNERVALELQTFRPLSLPGEQHKDEAAAVLEVYSELRNYIDSFGHAGIGSSIVSMTHSARDLFTVYLLAREAGLMLREGEDLVCPIPVVPLFETIDDLRSSSAILEEFLAHPITRASLKWQQKGRKKPLQHIMIGYSDSTKDGGIIASQWNLYRAQKDLQAVAIRHDVDLCFFHGRGGTVSRGAGPVHRFLEALPPGTLHGAFRMTEQGETIARKYANFASAVYNLEQLLASTTAESLCGSRKSKDDLALAGIMERLSAWSQDSYQALIHEEDFISFFRQATPIDVLENARIGSRPSKRTGQASLEDLRAIPWVFSWNQSRFYLPSWYGVGTALAKLEEEDREAFGKICRNLSDYKLLNYILYNVETTVASASLEIMNWYAGLISDGRLRETFMSRISKEFHLSQSMLKKIFGDSIDARRPNVVKTIALREQGLRLLHRMQIEQIRAWRQAPAQSAERELLLSQLLHTVNAIAAGVRNTG